MESQPLNPEFRKSRNAFPTFNYCNFHENFIFAKTTLKDIFAFYVKNSQMVHYLPTSVNCRMIFPFSLGFISVELRMCEVSLKIKPSQKFLNYSIDEISFLTLHKILFSAQKIVQNPKLVGSPQSHLSFSGTF